MHTEQYNGLIAALRRIESRLPEPPPWTAEKDRKPTSDDAILLDCAGCGARAREHCRYPDGGMCTSRVRRGEPVSQVGVRTAGQRQALTVMLAVLDSWVEGAKANHAALEHHPHPLGMECWTRFHVSDIKNMIDDAARELGIGLNDLL